MVRKVNERLKLFKKLVKTGNIDTTLWVIHFSDSGKRPDKCRCEHCFDFKSGLCGGGVDPIKCFGGNIDE